MDHAPNALCLCWSLNPCDNNSKSNLQPANETNHPIGPYALSNTSNLGE